MQDTNFIDILPFDEVEILDHEPSMPNLRYRVVGLSRSKNLVTLARTDDAGHVTHTLELPPHMVHVLLLAWDPRSGAKYSADMGMEESKHYLNVFQAFVNLRTGDFDEWRASEPTV